MSTDTSMTIRMDSKLKKEAESICQDMGITFSAAIMIFTKRMVKEKGIPFKLTADPFYSEENIKKLEAAARRMDEGRYVVHEIPEKYDKW